MCRLCRRAPLLNEAPTSAAWSSPHMYLSAETRCVNRATGTPNVAARRMEPTDCGGSKGIQAQLLVFLEESIARWEKEHGRRRSTIERACAPVHTSLTVARR